MPINSPNYNDHMESFHALLEKECITWNEIINFTHGYKIINNYIKFYNEERIHGILNYMSSNEFIIKAADQLKFSIKFNICKKNPI